MPIPFILAGAALAAAGYGVKKGYDAKCDYDKAEYYNEKARDIFDEAKDELERARIDTNSKIEELGQLKLDIYNTSLKRFVDTFTKIKNIDFKSNNSELDTSVMNYEKFLDIKQSVLKIHEITGGIIASLGSGALAGFGAFGGAGMLATASTGTAISSLSGAAATNATLAWFGGGSLAAGGLGMAGGAAILGCIVAGPIIGVAGFMTAAKAEEARHQARKNYDKARAYAEEMRTVKTVVNGIRERVLEFINFLKPLNIELNRLLGRLDMLVYYNDDYRSYKDEDKEFVRICYNVACTIKNVCDAPIIDESGKITQKSKEVLEEAKMIISEIESV